MAEMDLDVWEKRLLKVLNVLAPKEYRKLLRSAGNLLRKNVRYFTPKGPFKPERIKGKVHKPGDLRKSYRVRVKVKQGLVDVYTNKFYAKMVEEGHPIVRYDRVMRGRRVRRIKRVLGHVPGKFYFRKGFEKTEQELPDLLKDYVRTLGREMGLDVKG